MIRFAALGVAFLFPVLGLCEGTIYSQGGWHKASEAGKRSSVWNFASLFSSNSNLGTNAEKLSQEFIALNVEHFNDSRESILVHKDVFHGPELTTVRFQKSWNGIPVQGDEALVHIQDGQVVSASGDSTNLNHLSASPRLSAQEAEAMAYASYAGRAASTKAPELKVLILNPESAHLAYEVTVRDRDGFSSDIHFIDAHTGKELMVTTNVHTFTNRKIMVGHGDEQDFELKEDGWKTVYNEKGCGPNRSPALAPVMNLTSNASGPAPCISVAPAVLSSAKHAWNNSGLVSKYFAQAHNRNSIDGKGMQIKAVVHFGGPSFANAAYVADKNLMLYGAGDGQEYEDFAVALDIAGHELTHGITSRTAKLVYAHESGALNESFSDVFGKLIAFRYGKANDWKIGKELFKDKSQSVRDMENPDVDHMDKFQFGQGPCHSWNDFCGVHINSGIPNKAAVLMAKKIGLQKLSRIYYLTLTQLLRSNSTFKEARAQTEQACKTLYGATSKDCQVVAASFEAVGIKN